MAKLYWRVKLGGVWTYKCVPRKLQEMIEDYHPAIRWREDLGEEELHITCQECGADDVVHLCQCKEEEQ